MKTSAFISALCEVRLPEVFNPYSDRCELYDRDDAALRRRKNLQAFIDAALDSQVDAIWVGRDLGYRGGRRTGVPLTDEAHLQTVSAVFHGVKLSRATRGPSVSERTATVVWDLITRISAPVFLWNVFPFHPYEKGDQFSNRCHTRYERELTLPFLHLLIDILKPKRLVAIGKDAENALADFPLPVFTVRHPSYGGQAEFIAGIHKLYGIKDELPLVSAISNRD